MNTNKQFDEDDLVLYALRLLRESEEAAVAGWVRSDADALARLANLQMILGLYAEAEVQPTEIPEGSRSRLLARVALEKGSSVQPSPVPRPTIALVPQRGVTVRRLPALAQFGWAAAAALALALGLSVQRWSSLQQQSGLQSGQLASLSREAAELRGERDTLQARSEAQRGQIAAQAKTTESLAAKARASSKDADALQTRLAGQAASLKTQAARVAEAEHERSDLAETLAAQNGELARLAEETNNAEVYKALTDPTALRVVLTRPKAAPAPTGRAAYVVSKGTLVFLGSNLLPLQAAKVYELWILPADGSSPVPAGTFVPDARGNATLAYARFPRAVPAKGFAVTIENAGGAQTPTLPLILAGT